MGTCLRYQQFVIGKITMQKIAILMACHNRRDKTLTCLDALFINTLPDDFSFKVFLVDDGSTDGTTAAVLEKYPAVSIIYGDGNLFWSGGMRLAWDVAAKQKFDYYLWLNDDTNIYPNAIEKLIDSARQTMSQSIICATVCSKISGEITYGGKLRWQERYHIPNNQLQECEIISGNCVLIPNYVYQIIGNIDEKFIHAIGDWDYGLRAVNNGIKCFVAPTILGTCESNLSLPKWCLPATPLKERIKSLYSPLANSQPWPYFIYVSRHFGITSGFRQLISMHLRVIFPNFWKYLKNSSSKK